MGAILGRIETGNRPICLPRFEQAFSKLEVFGTDARSVFADHSIALGFTEKTLTEAPSPKPYPHDGFQALIAADVIIDNRAALGRTLGLNSDLLEKLSDAELISKSYQRWGIGCLSHLKGDYAFACLDRQTRSVVLARDHIGSRPLYWARRDDAILFGTSVEAIVGFDDFHWAIDEEIVAQFLTSSSYPISKTFFSEIYTVPAGHFAKIDRTNVTVQRWWNPSTQPMKHGKNRKDVIAEGRHILRGAVNARSQSSQPVGSHISGGLDSSGVTVLAHRILRSRGKKLVGAYAWGPGNTSEFPIKQNRDERAIIERLARDEGFLTRYGAASSDYYVAFQKRPMEFDGITHLPDELPILEAAKSDGVGIMLSGWGGDEAFSSHGYGYLGHLFYSARFKAAARFARTRTNTLRSLRILSSLAWSELIHPLFPPIIYRWLKPGALFEVQRKASLISSTLNRRYQPARSRKHRTLVFGINPNANLNRHLNFGHLGMRMEGWAMASARHGFQYRYPLTDRDLLEFLLTTSPQHLFLDDKPRGLARRILSDCVPMTTSKYDFINEKLRHQSIKAASRRIAEEAVLGSLDEQCPWIDQDKLRKRLDPESLVESEMTRTESVTLLSAMRALEMYKRAKFNGWVDPG